MTEAEALAFDFDNDAHWLGLDLPEQRDFIRVQDRVREELKRQPYLTHPLIHSPRMNIGKQPVLWMAMDHTFVWYVREIPHRDVTVKVLHQGITAHFRSQLRRCDTLCSENLNAASYDKWLRSLANAITAYMNERPVPTVVPRLVSWNDEAWYETGYWQDPHGLKVALPRFFHALYEDKPIVVGLNIAYMAAGHGEPSYVAHSPIYLDATTLKELDLKGVKKPIIAPILDHADPKG